MEYGIIYASLDAHFTHVRICPGQLLADDTVYMGIVTMLALFDIGPLTSGKPPQYTPNVIRSV